MAGLVNEATIVSITLSGITRIFPSPATRIFLALSSGVQEVNNNRPMMIAILIFGSLYRKMQVWP
jgi:hypothetical protein